MTVRGVAELEMALDSLVDREFIKVQRAAGRDAGKVLVEAAKNLVPYDEDSEDDYHLRDAIRVQSEPTRTRTSEVQFRIGPARETASDADRYGRAGYAIKGAIISRSSKAPNYASLVEEDTPFMRPAFEQKADEMVEAFRSRLQKRIESIARKAAKAKAAP